MPTGDPASAGDAAAAELTAQIASAESAVRSGELTHAAGALEEAVEEVAAAPKDCVSRLLLGCQLDGPPRETPDGDVEYTLKAPPGAGPGRVVTVRKGRALLVLGPRNPLRVACAVVVSAPLFDNFILAVIGFSCVCLVLDNPLLDTTSGLGVFLADANYVLLVIFCGEMGLKLLALGLVCECEASYLCDPWNVIDCVVVVSASLTQWGGDAMDLSALKPLRALRAMRPLRAMRRFPGIRIIVEAMISSVPDVANVLAVCAIFFMIFAIFCVNFLKGQFRACQGPDSDDVISGSPIERLLQAPTEWHRLLPEEKGWFGPGSNVTGGSWGAAGADGGGGCLAGADWPSAQCCPQWDPVWLDARAPMGKVWCGGVCVDERYI